MLFRDLTPDPCETQLNWEDLNYGAPTIIALARLCAHSMAQPPVEVSQLQERLSPEARAILVAAAKRGTIEIRAQREPVDSVQRFLAVCVETECEDRLLFLQPGSPQQTVRFLEAFRQLCSFGLILHHLQREFSLSGAGFELANTLDPVGSFDLLAFGKRIDHYE